MAKIYRAVSSGWLLLSRPCSILLSSLPLSFFPSFSSLHMQKGQFSSFGQRTMVGCLFRAGPHGWLPPCFDTSALEGATHGQA